MLNFWLGEGVRGGKDCKNKQQNLATQVYNIFYQAHFMLLEHWWWNLGVGRLRGGAMELSLFLIEQLGKWAESGKDLSTIWGLHIRRMFPRREVSHPKMLTRRGRQDCCYFLMVPSSNTLPLFPFFVGLLHKCGALLKLLWKLGWLKWSLITIIISIWLNTSRWQAGP